MSWMGKIWRQLAVGQGRTYLWKSDPCWINMLVKFTVTLTKAGPIWPIGWLINSALSCRYGTYSHQSVTTSLVNTGQPLLSGQREACISTLSTLPTVNSLRPIDKTSRRKFGSTLVQGMACCLTAPSHYLHQCWLLVKKIIMNTHIVLLCGMGEPCVFRLQRVNESCFYCKFSEPKSAIAQCWRQTLVFGAMY